MKPFVKWAGGKKQILDPILDKIKKSVTAENKDYTFIEPFVGGGVVFLALNHPNTIINDLNKELITAYRVVRDNPQALMNELDELYEVFRERGQDFYYEMRDEDKDPNYRNADDLFVASRMIFLNKTCFNGLYRVNSEGYFNTPIGRNRMISMYEKENLEKVSKFLKSIPEENIMNGSYRDAMRRAVMGDIVYVDPPYDYTENDGFTKYQKEGFSLEDLKELKQECDRCCDCGATVIISNNDTPKVRETFGNDTEHDYSFYFIDELNTKRSINCKGSLRNTGKEIIIWGLPLKFPTVCEMNLLLKYTRIKNPNDLKDEKLLEKRFRHSKTRVEQVISCLRYFKIINNNREFTDAGKSIRNAKSDKSNSALRRVLLNNEVINEIYKHDNALSDKQERYNIVNIVRVIREHSQYEIKDSVANKTAKTIYEIVGWCLGN